MAMNAYYEAICPSLKDVWQQYLPHEALITEFIASDGDCFGFKVGILHADAVFVFMCRSTSVTVIWLNAAEQRMRTTHHMSHKQCLAFLEGLPSAVEPDLEHLLDL